MTFTTRQTHRLTKVENRLPKKRPNSRKKVIGETKDGRVRHKTTKPKNHKKIYKVKNNREERKYQGESDSADLFVSHIYQEMCDISNTLPGTKCHQDLAIDDLTVPSEYIPVPDENFDESVDSESDDDSQIVDDRRMLVRAMRRENPFAPAREVWIWIDKD